MTQADLDTLARLLTDANDPSIMHETRATAKSRFNYLIVSNAADLLAFARVGLAQRETLAKLKVVEAERDELQARIANALL